MTTQLAARVNELQSVLDAAQKAEPFDINLYNEAKNKLETAREQLAQEQQLQQIEQKIHETDIPLAVVGADFTNLPSEVIVLIEAVVKADRKRIYAETGKEAQAAAEALRATELQLASTQDSFKHAQQTVMKLEQDKEQAVQLNTRLQQDLANITMEKAAANAERDEALQYRDNAANQLSELQAELASLKQQLADAKAAVKAQPDQTPIQADADDTAAINSAVESVKRLYKGFENFGAINKVTKPDDSFELVSTKDLQEKWQPMTSPPSIGGTADASFRTETPAAHDADGGIHPAEESQATVTFPTPAVSDQNDAVQGERAHGALETQAEVTRAEFEELQRRVTELEIARTQGAA